MVGYNQAARIAMVPFPDVLTRIAYLSLIIIVVVVPVVIERFTMSPVMTPMLTLFAVFLFLSIHCISIQLESPYGEDYVRSGEFSCFSADPTNRMRRTSHSHLDEIAISAWKCGRSAGPAAQFSSRAGHSQRLDRIGPSKNRVVSM